MEAPGNRLLFRLLLVEKQIRKGPCNLVSRVSHHISSFASWGAKMRDPRNEVEVRVGDSRFP